MEVDYKWPLVGNDNIKKFLSLSLEKKKLAHAYIFSGLDNLGKASTAVHFAQILLCQKKEERVVLPCGECQSCKMFASLKSSKDENEQMPSSSFSLIKRNNDKKNISIEQIQTLVKSLNLSSLSGDYKIVLIRHADKMSEEAANALLKTLEEPRKKTIIILVTSFIDYLPQTIASRCQVINFHPVNKNDIFNFLIDDLKISRSAAKNYSQLCLGRPALAIKFVEDGDFYDKYLENIKAFVSIFSTNDINKRLSVLRDDLKVDFRGQKGAQETARILEVWQGLVRDIYLLQHSEPDLIQNDIVSDDLHKIKTKFSDISILKFLDNIEQSFLNLQANINGELVLENLIINS